MLPVAISGLTKCCLDRVEAYRRAGGSEADGECLECGACGRSIIVREGMWRRKPTPCHRPERPPVSGDGKC